MTDDNEQDLQDQLVLLQAKLLDKVQEYLLPSGEEFLTDLLFVARYQNNARHTYKLTREALEKILEKYKDK